jgi:hypothetical protein
MERQAAQQLKPQALNRPQVSHTVGQALNDHLFKLFYKIEFYQFFQASGRHQLIEHGM